MKPAARHLVAHVGEVGVQQRAFARPPVALGAVRDDRPHLVGADGGHARAGEDGFAHVLEVRAARGALDRGSQQVVAVGRIDVARPGLGHERIVLEEGEAARDAGVGLGVRGLLVAVVADAPEMPEELARRHRPRLLRVGGNVALDGRVEIQLAVLRQLEHGRRGDGLGDRGQPVHGGRAGGDAVLDVREAVALGEPERAPSGDRHRGSRDTDPGQGGGDRRLHGLDLRGRADRRPGLRPPPSGSRPRAKRASARTGARPRQGPRADAERCARGGCTNTARLFHDRDVHGPPLSRACRSIGYDHAKVWVGTRSGTSPLSRHRPDGVGGLAAVIDFPVFGRFVWPSRPPSRRPPPSRGARGCAPSSPCSRRRRLARPPGEDPPGAQPAPLRGVPRPAAKVPPAEVVDLPPAEAPAAPPKE